MEDDTVDAREDADRFEHDPDAVHATTGVYRDIARRVYAFCSGGFVRAMRSAMVHEPHPFDDVEMHVMGQAGDPRREHVIDVTGAVCHPGFVVDNKGQVAPPPPSGEPLTIRDPAYHDRSNPEALPTLEAAGLLSRPPVPGGPSAPDGNMTNARLENLPGGHPGEGNHDEHDARADQADAEAREKAEREERERADAARAEREDHHDEDHHDDAHHGG